MTENSLSEMQDNLQKQKLEGFSEYSNKLNSLNAKKFTKFLVTTEEARPKSHDLKNFVRNGVKPFHALKQVLEFFTVEGDLVLDVFSGTGETLKMISDMNRLATGIEKDSSKVAAYKTDVEADSFLDCFPIIEKDALEASLSLTGKYDFILVDPPVKTPKMAKDQDSIGDRPLEDYVSYISDLISSLSKNLVEGKFLVCLMQDFYYKGKYYTLPALVANKVENLKLKGIKIYFRHLDINTIPNKKVYAPVQNHFYALIFTL